MPRKSTGAHHKYGRLPRGWQQEVGAAVVAHVRIVERYSNAGLFILSDCDEKGYRWVRLCVGHPYANRHGWQRLHRYLMMRRLGRVLKPYEHCHHKEGADKDTLNAWDLELLEDVEHGMHHYRERLRRRIPGDMRESWCARDERGRFTKIPTTATNGRSEVLLVVDLDHDYLVWLYENVDLRGDLKDAIESLIEEDSQWEKWGSGFRQRG